MTTMQNIEPWACLKSGSLQASPAIAAFGENVVKACEFAMREGKERKALRNSIILLIASLAILGGFLGFLFRHDPFGKKAQLVYTTCVGAILGVMLSFLVSRSVKREANKAATVIGQFALACFLRALYGFFALHAGSLYSVEVKSLTSEGVDSLARNMALLGVGVGALLGPASKKAL